jgi:mono/diheme cytochrome c family protein
MNPIRSAAALVVLAVLFTRPAGSIRPAVTSQTPAAPRAVPWADWVEPTFPFFSSVVDARQAAPAFPGDNLTPRALVLNLGRDHWVAFDTDLLRVSAAWRGKGLSARALAPGSYLHPDRKTPGGQVPAPEPEGTLWVANGIYPGWQIGAAVLAEDPRESAPSAEEIGRGPLPERFGRFKAVRLVRDGAVLEYTAAGADVREWMTVFQADGRPAESSIVRHFEVGPTRESLWLVVGHKSKEVEVSLGTRTGVPIVLDAVPAPKQGLAARDAGQGARRIWVVKVLPHDTPINFSTAITYGASIPPTIAPHAIPTDAAAPRWPREITTKVTRSTSKDAYVVDDIELPVENPWRRNVRPGDVQFLKDGTGAVVTLDGDVWLVRGLHEAGGTARWRRFASGLHEPLTLAVRDEQLYVYDRNGIWRLRDTNGDGEADVHELFSNAFAQTADMREFPNTIRLAPDGEFVIAKGNQQAVTIGKHNGHVLRVSADGRRVTSLGYGFRQPNIGVNIRTGLVTASDQQGHYIPTTPLHIVRDRQFYGFLSDKEPREQYPAPIADPLTWIPHATNASAMSQVWLFSARMGPLNDALVHIGFNKPELFRVMLNERSAKPQAAIVSITRAFDFPPNNGAVNPGDGQLYIAGFQILGWGTTASRLTGMGRVRYTGAVSTLPSEVVPMDKGILARFDAALDRQAATNPDNYSITSWQYKRTYQYGSPQFKSDGTPGIDRLTPSSAYLSQDGRSVFIAVPEMTRVMQMRLGWSLATSDGTRFQESAFFTPFDLPPFDPRAEGFGDVTVDLSPRAASAIAATQVSIEEGQRLYQLYGCMACHSTDASVTRLGPTFKGLFGAERPYAKGVLRTTATEEYLRESILEPASKVVAGYERGESGMPSYAGVLNEQQVESILLFIKSLK